MLGALAGSLLPAVEPSGGALNGQKPRVFISTDIGGDDPDDYQSMVHLFVYLDVLQVEGLISSPPGAGRASHIREVIDAYALDYSKLSTWGNYPTPDALRNMTKQGATSAQSSTTPPSTISSGAQLLIDRAKASDSRPLHVLVWGSITDVAQAVHKDPTIKSKLRVYAIGSWNTNQDPNAMNYLKNNHVKKSSDALWMIENNTTFRGMYNGGNQSGDLGNSSFPSNHVDNHGALGELFMAKKSSIKMGDTPSVLYMLAGDFTDPTKEHWGGQFARNTAGASYWVDRSDYVVNNYKGAGTVAKWREAFLRDWQYRMDRCVTAKSGGDTTAPVAKAGADQTVTDSDGNGSESVQLSSAGSSDNVGITSYVWKEGTTTLSTNANPTVTLGVGSHTITLTVQDAAGNSASDSVLVTVNAAPEPQTGLVTGLSSRFAKASLAVGNTIYTDRAFTLSSTLGYAGAEQIQTPNNDKGNTASSGYLVFDLSAAAEVYIAYDARSSSRPDWMAGFSATGEALTTTDTSFALYKRSYAAGSVSLGGNSAPGASGAGSNYWVFATASAPSADTTAPVANAGADQTVTDSDGNGSESVQLSSAGSSDNVGITSYLWKKGTTTLSTSANPTLTLAVGSHTITLTVQDAAGNSASDTVVITVNAAPDPVADTIKINFQPGNAPTVSGYLVDAGETFASRNGQSYGWNSANSSTRDRNVDSDQRQDTLIHLQKSGGLKWELALPDGSYSVRVVAGDPSYTNQVNSLSIEGQVVADPDGADNFDELSVTVSVSDGRLTIAPAADASNAKLCYIEVTPVEVAPSGVAINFQPAGAAPVDGYLIDAGGTFASRDGQSYGWNVLNDSTRERNLDSDQRKDTLIHLQKSGGLRWELALPDGLYSVQVVMGDPGYTNQLNALSIEGTVVSDGSQDHFDSHSVEVEVADGRLTLEPAADSQNAKLNYIEVTPLGANG